MIPLSVPKLRVVEFFSGIGGWHSALNHLPQYPSEVIAAYDVNPMSNAVYEHVYRLKPSSQSIESLTVKSLDALSADIWCMSPPCQPYTRQHPTMEDDPRAKAFTHLCRVLQQMTSPPTYIAVENVIGFETSSSCQMLLDVFDLNGYDYRQFALTPTQFGIPNERPRYYCVATRCKRFDHDDDISEEGSQMKKSTIYTAIPGSLPTRSSCSTVAPLRSYLSGSLSIDEIELLVVPETLLAKNASWCMDIVSMEDTTSSCFTKAYSTYFKGTGSVLLFPDDRSSRNDINTDSSLEHMKAKATTSSSTVATEANENAGSVLKQSPLLEHAELEFTTVQHRLKQETGPIISSPISAVSVFQQTPSTRKFDADWKTSLQGYRLRFFAPDELIRLFGFININDPLDSAEQNEVNDRPGFFPPGMTHRKCYELIGNSLNVMVVTQVLQYMFGSRVCDCDGVTGSYGSSDMLDMQSIETGDATSTTA